MTSLNEYSPYVLPMAVAIALSVAFSLGVVCLLMSHAQKKYVQRLEKMEATLNVITSGSLGMGQKMLTLEKRLAKLRETQEEMKSSDLGFSYTQAQQLIAGGADDRTVAANSGLTATEINLMRMLHNQQGGPLERKRA